MAGDRRRLRGAERRLLKGYAPLVVLVAALVVMVAVVPSKVPADLAAAGRGEATEVAVGQPATGWNETVTACPDRQVQVPDLGYSPPCFAFAGDNGGETTRGVTADTITGQLPRHVRPQPAPAPRPARRRAARRVERGDVPDDGGAGRVGQRQLPALRPEDRAGPLRRPRADPPRVHRGRAGRRHQRQHQGGQRDRRLRRHHRDHPAVRRRAGAQRGRRRGRPLHVARVVRGPPPVRVEHRARLHDHGRGVGHLRQRPAASAARPTTPATTWPTRNARWP